MRQPAEHIAQLELSAGGQLADLIVVVCSEVEQITAVGADRLPGGGGVGRVGEEVADVLVERMPTSEVLDHDRSIRISRLPENSEPDRAPDATSPQLAQAHGRPS